ncbi:hypothetical protein AB0C38_21095 [Amycolatopsis sp. NPDC048633]|uniref:hypothetical protein n=1 Tax=Amycolatopsis sp. NPDC048633 TaxID=3157095 RepID=UPI0033FDFF24
MRRTAIYVAALATASALTGAFAAPAGAEEPDPATTSAAPSTSEAPPSSSTVPGSTAPSSTPVETKPEAPAVKAERAQVAVSLVFDKDSYTTDEEVRFTFKVTNVGQVRAAGLTVYQQITEATDLNVPYDGWGKLRAEPGVTLEPGESFELAVSGTVRDVEKDTTVVRGVMFDETHFGVSPSFEFSRPITKAAGHAEGLVYGDKNGNGKYDAGEALSGAKLTLRYRHGSGTYTATSGPDGKITFDVPGAEYFLGGEVVDGWLIPFRVVRIGADTQLTVRGAPPLNGALKATMAFTQDSYKVGELAHVTVTLANSGPIPLTGITAACNRIGDPHHLTGRTPGWGDLAGDGVTIAPGETRTFDVSEAVPEASFNRGYVVVACDFGYDEVDSENHANASDQAAVPGGKATVEGAIGVFDNQGNVAKGVAGAKVVLVSDQHCPVVGERTTDAQGHFEFLDVVPGPEYHLYVLPPKGWKVLNENPMSINVSGPPENHYLWRISAEEGDAPLPAVPVNPADCGKPGTPTSTTAPAGSGGGESGGSGLASTGVDVLGIGALALVALVLGGGLVISTRRRRNGA